MDADEIKAIYDSNLDMTLSDLSKITGLSIGELKKILLEG